MPSSRIKKIYTNLKYKYRLVIYNETTFETEYNLYLSKLNVILLFSTLLLVGMLLSICLISFTSVKYYLPGFGEEAVRKQLREVMAETDELRKSAKQNELYLENIKQVLTGKIPASKIHIEEEINIDSIK
jgi:hypothetical protein